jgi:putative spermidine/putrescine transport system ATP-binding protein
MQKETASIGLISCGKTFKDGTRALEKINLNINSSETVVLLGPSGCGKTTLLRIIAGLEEPDKGGKIIFNEDDVTKLQIEKRNVGMVFQSYALFPNMNVKENIGYGLKVRKLDKNKIDERVSEMLKMMHITDLSFRNIDQLSGGQRQRVALARAIAVRPRVLLLDEPLTALDAILRDRLRVEIDILLRNLGITAIYVTHDQSEAMALGDRIVVMSNGQISQIGTPRNIYYNPANEFVADFIGTVNRIHANNVKNLNSFEGKELLFRPDDIDIVEKQNCHFSGIVKASFFLGEKTRLIVNLNLKDEVTVEGKFEEEYKIGSEISLRINTDALIELPK